METQTEQLLIVDDDAGLRDLLTRYFREQGFQADAVADGAAMDAWLAKRKPDLVVLDLMLPGEDGLSLARRLRASSSVPIIMLSARGDDVDRIVGLEVGADDYIPKPFNPRELLARVRAVLRRRESSVEAGGVESENRSYAFGPYVLETGSQRLTRGGEDIALTSGEFNLLRIFVERPNRVLSRDTLVDLIKGYERTPFDRSIDVRVARLRGKIELNSREPRYIRTVWGEGYLFAPEGDTK